MRVGPLTLFKRMHSNGTPINTWIIAAWHWPWSITWRWGLDFDPFGHRLFAFWGYRHRWTLRIWPFRFDWQENMPWKKEGGA